MCLERMCGEVGCGQQLDMGTGSGNSSTWVLEVATASAAAATGTRARHRPRVRGSPASSGPSAPSCERSCQLRFQRSKWIGKAILVDKLLTDVTQADEGPNLEVWSPCQPFFAASTFPCQPVMHCRSKLSSLSAFSSCCSLSWLHRHASTVHADVQHILRANGALPRLTDFSDLSTVQVHCRITGLFARTAGLG